MYSLSYEIIIVEKESTNSHVLFDTYTIVGPSIDGPGDKRGVGARPIQGFPQALTAGCSDQL